LAMVVAIGCCEGTRRLRRPPRDNLAASPQSAPIEPERDQSDAARADRAGILAMSVVVVLSVILSAVAFSQVTTRFSRTFTSSWANPDAPTMSAIAKLEAAGVTTGYADYWVAYKLDFLSQGRLTITTAGYDADRSRQINAAVVASKRPAWLFVPTSESHLVGTQFTAPTLIVGPDGVPESQFLSTLHKLGVHYRIIDTGIVQAVVPLEPVSQLQAQLPGVSAG
jgi:hypothetical protein